MAEQRVQRKLTTILAADFEGYSRLMSADEEATLETLKSYREIIDGLIGKHDGRIFGTGGDSVIAEFTGAVEAVRCAITIQEELGIRNAGLAAERVMPCNRRQLAAPSVREPSTKAEMDRGARQDGHRS